MNNKWMCITDKGIIFLDEWHSLDFVETVIKYKGCRSYTIHKVNDDNILYILGQYFEDCYELENNEVE